MRLTRLCAPALVVASMVAATGCSTGDSAGDATVDTASEAENVVVECEHQVLFEQSDVTLSIDSEADPGTGARAYEVTDAAGEVRDSGAVAFVFADDGLLNGVTLPLEVRPDFGVDFSVCKPDE